MNKMKQVSYAVASVALVAPAAAFAQLQTVTGTNLPEKSITDIIKNAMNWLLMMVGVLSVVGFVISGILYLTAAGNEDQINRAKSAMIYSIVGVLVSMLGLIVFAAMKKFLGGETTI